MALPALAAFAGIAARALASVGGRALAGAVQVGGAAARTAGATSSRLAQVAKRFEAGPFGRAAKAAKQIVEHQIKPMFGGSAGSVSGQQKPPTAPPQPSPVSQLAGKSAANFGNLLSGKTTDAELQQQDADEKAAAAKEESAKQEQEAAEAAAAALKSLVLGAGVAAVTLPLAAKKFAESVLGAREYLAQFNGQIAGAFARMKQQDVRLNIRTGAATAGTTTALAGAVMQMKEAIQPIREALVNIFNFLGAIAARFVEATVFIVNQFIKLVNLLGDLLGVKAILQDILDWLRGKPQGGLADPFRMALDDIMQQAGQRKRPPLRPAGQGNPDPWGNDRRRPRRPMP